MSKMRNLFHLQLWILVCYISYHCAFGVQLHLTRSQTGDYFNNPYSTSCNEDDDRFCVATKSICYQNRPKQGDKCCYCRCQVTNSTFSLTTFRCAPNSEYRQAECFYRFGGDRRYDELYLNEIDMTVRGDEKLVNRNLDDKSQKHLKNCVVNKVEQINSTGYETVASHPFSVDNKKNHFELEWSSAYGDKVYGKVYRITLTCKYKSTSISGCLMLKSAGTVQVYRPGLPEISSSVLPTSKTTASLVSSSSSVSSTSQWTVSSSSPVQEILPTSTAKEFIKPSSAFIVNSPSLTQSINPLQFSVEEERGEVSTTKSASSTIDNRENPKETMAFSSSSIVIEFPTSPDKDRQSIEKDGNIVIYIAVVVVFVVIIALVVVILFIIRRKKKKTLKKHESQANIMLSDMNKNNVNKDEDSFYTSLDKSAGNDESNYEALRFPEANKHQPSNEKMLQSENEYAYVDADRLYSTIDDDKKLGAKNDAFDASENERVYSILETEPGQISYPTPSRVRFEPAGHGYTGDSDVDYLTVLPSRREPGQSDCPVYADLLGRRDGENEYQSLVKRKK